MQQFTPEDISTLLKQIEWQRYREGTYSNQDPLVAIKAKLRNMRTALKDDGKPNGRLDNNDLGLLLHATLNSIDYVNSYDYGFEPDVNARLKKETLLPLLDIASKLRARLGEQEEIIVVIENDNVLTNREQEELEQHEAIIEHGLATFVEVGNALAVIRDKRLYRIAYRTFEEYCQERWGLSRIHAHRMIGAAQTTSNLLPIGNKLPTTSKDNHYLLPTYESQVRPLTHLEPEQQREVWQRAVETAPDGKITAAHVQKTVELMTRPSMAVHYSSETDEWNTPPEIIERTLKVLGKIDLDPCSNSHKVPNVPATQHYVKEDDGLRQEWHGRIYMNPPYGREIAGWVKYLCIQFEGGNVTEAIALLPARTDTEWFRQLRQYPRCFIWGRLRFSGNEVGAPFPSMVIYMGHNLARFLKAFSDIGDTYVFLSTASNT